MKTKFYEFDPAIYPFPLLVCKYKNQEDIKDNFYICTSKSEAEEAGDNFKPSPTRIATTIPVLEKGTDKVYLLTVVFRPEWMTIGLYAHEALHINSFLSDFLGINAPSCRDDEPQAYFVGWVADCIHSVVEKNPKDMKGFLHKFPEKK